MMDSFDSFGRELSHEYSASLEVLRRAKNAFFCIGLLAVASHLVSWGVSRYSTKLGPFSLSAASAAQPDFSEAEYQSGRRWQKGVESAITWAGFLGRVSVCVLVGIQLVALIMSLTGKLGGAEALTRAIVWLLVALAMVVPWMRTTMDDALSPRSAFFEYDALASMRTDGGLIVWARFVLCPLMVGVCLVASQLCFRQAYRKITMTPSVRLPIHEV
jgi:hypothetical protein